MEEGDALFEAIENLVFQGTIQARDGEILSARGIVTFRELKNHLSQNTIIPLSDAKVAAICEGKAESNLTQTNANIGRRAQLDSLTICKKRNETLETSIRLGARGEAQIAHWKMELKACRKRLRNMLGNNF